MYAQWGGGRGYSNINLNYAALNQALIDKGKSKTGPIKYRSILFLYQRYVQAYRYDKDTIALKLHRTEIIHYHNNGLRTLYDDGWIGAAQTRSWFRNASIRISNYKPNPWSAVQWCVADSEWKPISVFYDGMQVDQAGNVVTKRKPVLVHTPNAEAKALRKRLTKLGQVYKQFAMLHAGSEQQRFEYVNKYHESTIASIDPATHEFDLDLYKQLYKQLHRASWRSVPNPYQRVLQSLAEVYKREVHRRNLLDVKPVIGEVNE